MARRSSQQNNYSREQQMALQASLRRGRVVSTPAAAVTNRGQQSNSSLRQRSDKERNTRLIPESNNRRLSGFGTPMGTSIGMSQPTKPSNVANAALTALGGPVTRTVGRTVLNNTYLFGKKVVHGSPTKGLKEINPQYGSAARPNEKVNFSWNPRHPGFKRDKGNIVSYASEYTGEKVGGSYYVGKIKRKDIVSANDAGATIGKGPIRVKKEITRIDGSTKDRAAFDKAFPSSRLYRATDKTKYEIKRQIGKTRKSNKNRRSVV